MQCKTCKNIMGRWVPQLQEHLAKESTGVPETRGRCNRLREIRSYLKSENSLCTGPGAAVGSSGDTTRYLLDSGNCDFYNIVISHSTKAPSSASHHGEELKQKGCRELAATQGRAELRRSSHTSLTATSAERRGWN